MSSSKQNPISDKPRLVILGTGFGALSLVKALDTSRYDVVVVSPRNHFLFTPLLPSTTVGTLEFRSIIEPIRHARHGITFYQAKCTALDTDTKTISCEGAFTSNTFELPYDSLVIGVGAISNTFGVPGVAENALFLKKLSDARKIRRRICACFERAALPFCTDEDRESLLRFVVVGGGPTGIEMAAELSDFIERDIVRWFPELAPQSHILVLEARGEILSQFDARLSHYAINHLKKTRVDLRTGTAVKEVREASVVVNKDEEILCGMVVWSTGIGPTKLVTSTPFAKDRQSRILVDGGLRVPEADGIFVVGDCAAVEGHDLPPTAQVAQQQGAWLGKYFNRIARGKDGGEFKYKHLGMMAYIGGHRALADTKNVKSHGFGTWLLWRSAYLTKLMSFKSKFLVVQDWFKALIFGRDISFF